MLIPGNKSVLSLLIGLSSALAVCERATSAESPKQLSQKEALAAHHLKESQREAFDTSKHPRHLPPAIWFVDRAYDDRKVDRFHVVAKPQSNRPWAE
jgi:hypothetical protein